MFGGFGADRFRTALTRACTGAGVPTFSPHDLRHRRVSLLHAQGIPWARIGERVGHADLMTTARTYTHVLGDEAEIDYAVALARASEGWRNSRVVPPATDTIGPRMQSDPQHPLFRRPRRPLWQSLLLYAVALLPALGFLIFLFTID